MATPWPAKRVAQRVSWAGVKVRAVAVHVEPEIPSEFESAQANVLQLRPIENLQEEFPHNLNLRQQFAHLSTSFQAWRPIRGDGNCYYRAVLFAHIERCLTLRLPEPLEKLSEQLRELTCPEVQLCQQRLSSWLLQLHRGDVQQLALEFNRSDVDYAFVYCLRQLVARYVRRHGQDSMDGSEDGLTLEAWALAISGASDLEDYCQQYICTMHRDAADHVQWVCPRVLGCMVRICMVDRETARCAFIDYGQRCGPTRCVATAAQLAAPVEAPPEIFLLLKPGHYDILVPRAPSLWAACQAVLRCLEERLVTELRGKEPSGLEAFRRQLAAVVEPLHQLLQPQSAVPATRALLPALDGLLAPVGPAPKRAVRRRADCCVCIKGGAEITAKCGCAYHRACLERYARGSTSWNRLSCKLHRCIFGHDFLVSHLSDAFRPTSDAPCVICLKEQGEMKSLHCGFKVHRSCLKDFWCEKVSSLCRLEQIRCPADVAGCGASLTDADLSDVVSQSELEMASARVREVEEQNQRLIEELKQQSEEYRPIFKCAICLVDHEVEGCCTLPCQHRFCFESLQQHFELVVRERRLSKLTCPAEGCGYDLRTEESIHIFQRCLPEESYFKLLEFLTRDDPRVVDCRACEERVFCDEGDDFADLSCPKGHRFCAKCDFGPHASLSCAAAREMHQEKSSVWPQVLSMGWKPCPRRCPFGGGYKAQEECDHVTCECGHEFCWDCGIDRRIILAHDNRWHKPCCRYHTAYREVAELPKFAAQCPECKQGRVCPFPMDDGYPESYLT